jgi:DNA polymerase-3 subunit beta
VSDSTLSPASVHVAFSITFAVATFRKALELANRVVPRRCHKPILRMVRLSTTETTARLDATNLEQAIRVPFRPIRAESSGKVMLDPSKVLAWLKALPKTTQEATLEVTGDRIILSAGPTRSSFPIEEASEGFPVVPGWNPESSHWSIPSGEMVASYDRVAYATDVESTRYALGSVLLELADDGTGFAVATDGRRLARRTFDCEKVLRSNDVAMSFLVPVVALKMLRDLCKGIGEPALIQSAEHDAITAKVGEVTYYTRSQEGRFPRYQDVIPSNSDIDVTIPPSVFLEIAQQANATTTDEERGTDILARPCCGDTAAAVVVECQRSRVMAYTRQLDDPNVSGVGARCVTLDARYMVDLAKSLAKDSTPIVVRIIDDRNPVAFSAEGGRLVSIIMPLNGDRKPGDKDPLNPTGHAMLARFDGPAPVADVPSEPEPEVITLPEPSPEPETVVTVRSAAMAPAETTQAQPIKPKRTAKVKPEPLCVRYSKGDRVILARVNKPFALGVHGTVRRIVKSRDEVVVQMDGIDPKLTTSLYVADAANVDPEPVAEPTQDPAPTLPEPTPAETPTPASGLSSEGPGPLPVLSDIVADEVIGGPAGFPDTPAWEPIRAAVRDETARINRQTARIFLLGVIEDMRWGMVESGFREWHRLDDEARDKVTEYLDHIGVGPCPYRGMDAHGRYDHFLLDCLNGSPVSFPEPAPPDGGPELSPVPPYRVERFPGGFQMIPIEPEGPEPCEDSSIGDGCANSATAPSPRDHCPTIGTGPTVPPSAPSVGDEPRPMGAMPSSRVGPTPTAAPILATPPAIDVSTLVILFVPRGEPFHRLDTASLPTNTYTPAPDFPQGRPPGPRPGVSPGLRASLTLEIDGRPYGVARTPDGWDLAKSDRSSYRVSAEAAGWSCDCPTARFRGGVCKHQAALRHVGLIPATEPALV